MEEQTLEMTVNLEKEKKKNIRLAIGVASLGVVRFLTIYEMAEARGYCGRDGRGKGSLVPRGGFVAAAKQIIYVSFIVAIICVQLCIPLPDAAIANDTIVEITPQGLQFKREDKISIEKESLHISLKKIEVSYIFKNHSSKDITAEVAFPVPPYRIYDLLIGNHSHKPIQFGDFKAKVNNKQTSYKKEIRALVNGKDYAPLLQSLNISIEDFGKYDLANPDGANDVLRLTKEDKNKLLELGILNEGEPVWTVEIKYHWTQTFPANSSVNIKHSYTPYYGGMYGVFQEWQNEVSGEVDSGIMQESCLAQDTKKAIEERAFAKVKGTHKAINLYYDWVSYILTTANNWKQPIKDFHLIIEKPENAITSLCFGHKLIKTSPTRFEAHIKNFIPEKDLKVYFIFEEQVF